MCKLGNNYESFDQIPIDRLAIKLIIAEFIDYSNGCTQLNVNAWYIRARLGSSQSLP